MKNYITKRNYDRKKKKDEKEGKWNATNKNN